MSWKIDANVQLIEDDLFDKQFINIYLPEERLPRSFSYGGKQPRFRTAKLRIVHDWLASEKVQTHNPVVDTLQFKLFFLLVQRAKAYHRHPDDRFMEEHDWPWLAREIDRPPVPGFVYYSDHSFSNEPSKPHLVVGVFDPNSRIIRPVHVPFKR